MKPARGVDLRSCGEMRLKGRAIVDHKVMSGFPEREGQRLAALFGNRLPQVVGGRAGERDRERARGLVTHAGVCSDIAEQVDPIDHECHVPGLSANAECAKPRVWAWTVALVLTRPR